MELSPNGTATRAEKPSHRVRRIVLAERDRGRVRADRPRSEEIILLTNLTDAPAEVIAGIYEMRWSIELFFRFLKQVLGCHKLFSTRTEAANIQIYCALIACPLLARVTGGRIRMDVYRMICFYLQGLADEDELDEYLKKARLKESQQPPGRTR